MRGSEFTNKIWNKAVDLTAIATARVTNKNCFPAALARVGALDNSKKALTTGEIKRRMATLNPDDGGTGTRLIEAAFEGAAVIDRRVKRIIMAPDFAAKLGPDFKQSETVILGTGKEEVGFPRITILWAGEGNNGHAEAELDDYSNHVEKQVKRGRRRVGVIEF